ncbi:hypothetical protein VTK26DRAFT_6081 [Humicola hyalothermophila]
MTSPGRNSHSPWPASAPPSSLPESEMGPVFERLKYLAREAAASRVPYHNDGSEHYRVFSRAITNVLSTELALFKFAQIIDGLPTADVAWDVRSPDLSGAHPIEEHQDTLRSFQGAPLGSRSFHIRLIELVAVSMHEIGVLLFQLGLRLHQRDIESVDQWSEKPAGFNRILGGVTVFGRQAEARSAAHLLPNVYFFSCRDKVTVRYYQLRDDQQQSLLDFLLADSPDPSSSPLLILGDRRNTVRVDAHEAVFKHLYRDAWERKPPSDDFTITVRAGSPDILGGLTERNDKELQEDGGGT